MALTPAVPVALSARRSPWLRGAVRVPGDRAVSRLALVLAALARGESVIENTSGTADIAAFAAALRQLGASAELKAGIWRVRGMGVGAFLAPEAPIDLGPMGEGALLLIALLGAHDFETRFTGYVPTAMGEALLDFLHRTGAYVGRKDATITLRGPRFGLPLDLRLPAEALALKAPLLLAALVTTGTSYLHVPEGSDPSDSIAGAFGAAISSAPDETGTRISIEGMAPLNGRTLVVPGDPVFAAYPAVAALIAPDSEIAVEALSLAPTRMVLLDALKLLGGSLRIEPPKGGARDTADLVATHGKLKGAPIPASLRIEPEDFPILAAAAAFAEGETVFEGLGEGLPRLNLTRALRANGVECEERPGGLLVRGAARAPGGGTVATRLDPKLAMAFLVLGMAADKPVTVDDGGVVSELFPGFVEAFEHIGVRFTGGGAK